MADLDEEDIDKINYGKRLGYLFSGFIICFAVLWNAYYWFTEGPERDVEMLIWIDGAVVAFSLLVLYWMNRKANKDIETREKVIKLAQVTQKEAKATYEAGSASIAPGFWGMEMNSSTRYDLIIDNYYYEVKKEVFDQVEVGDFVEMHYTRHSGRLLKIDVQKEKTLKW